MDKSEMSKPSEAASSKDTEAIDITICAAATTSTKYSSFTLSPAGVAYLLYTGNTGAVIELQVCIALVAASDAHAQFVYRTFPLLRTETQLSKETQ
jgi:hypothetical protein